MSEVVRPPVLIDIRCNCGGALWIEYHPGTTYLSDLVALAKGWVEAHKPCSAKIVEQSR